MIIFKLFAYVVIGVLLCLLIAITRGTLCLFTQHSLPQAVPPWQAGRPPRYAYKRTHRARGRAQRRAVAWHLAAPTSVWSYRYATLLNMRNKSSRGARIRIRTLS